ncbi:MAG: TerB family tellurite resistance protein [Anaerolineales bacterium]|jgi:uncharacterized tellurite resistance protein B-like protein
MRHGSMKDDLLGILAAFFAGHPAHAVEGRMTEASFILTLGKVLIAAAWADGEISNEEINCLKDLLFQLPDLTGREWASLEMYIEAPVGPAERERLVQQLNETMRTSKDRELALKFLDQLAHADGSPSSDEQVIIGDMKSEINSASVGLIGQLGHVLQGAISRRQQALEQAPNRENHFEDYIKNKVYYGIQRRLESGQGELDVQDPRLRKMCLAGGLMARVAHVDQDVTEQELGAMVEALQEGWDLTRDEARFVTEVAVSEIGPEMDYYRLTRQFFTTTDEGERSRFLEVLFSIAAADGMATPEEIEEIRTIANTLRLTHRQFIDAKLTIPHERRAN